jgi:hypothetical protein
MKKSLFVLSLLILASPLWSALKFTHIRGNDIAFEQNGKKVYHVTVKIESDVKGVPARIKNYIVSASLVLDASGNVDDAKVVAIAQADLSAKAKLKASRAPKKVARIHKKTEVKKLKMPKISGKTVPTNTK